METTSVSNRNPTINSASVQIANQLEPSQRKSIFIVNVSPAGQVIKVACNDEASSTVGIPLSPGGYISDSASSDAVDAYFPAEFAYTAYSSAVGGKLVIFERIGRGV